MTGTSASESYNRRAQIAARRLFPNVDLDAMDLGFNLIRAANRLQQDLENNVHRPAGMTWAGFRVLFSIAVAGELSPHQIAHLSSISASSATSVLNTLEKYGYVSRVPHDSDGRSKKCTLTAEGTRVVAELFARNNHREIDWRATLTDEELHSTVASLKKLLDTRPSESNVGQARSSMAKVR